LLDPDRFSSSYMAPGFRSHPAMTRTASAIEHVPRNRGHGTTPERRTPVPSLGLSRPEEARELHWQPRYE